jgi:hypothetical protein
MAALCRSFILIGWTKASNPLKMSHQKQKGDGYGPQEKQ